MAGVNFNELDVLQGILIYLAWAHFQPSPKRYTQYLHLATSIVSDLRLDRPRRPKLWSVDGGKDRNEPDWGPDEMRALAGKLIENVEDIVSRTSPTNDGAQFSVESQQIAQSCADIKSTLPFPLSESLLFPAPLLLHLYMLELLLSQSSPQGTPFGLDKFQIGQDLSRDQGRLIDWLSASMSASRSLISVILILPRGEEAAMSNIGWIMMHCGLSLAVRLDLIAAKGDISRLTKHLRRLLDMPHTIRQIVLRLETAASSAAKSTAPSEMSNTASNCHPFDRLAKRARQLEDWYLSRVAQQAAQPTSSETQQVAEQSPIRIGTESLPFDNSTPEQNWVGDSNWFYGAASDISTFLFTNPVDFPGTFGL
ncbi:hypothetical protein FZEAL_1902 [Fusarium zealandicum]|uniref:Transcription factor n=1 Tax=Fusarium zealandicum TaxID=1053134 RepID=A0A8H4USE4_9HYPO|nr:hypothetical protein FZEAL_1902 [Fusarium zealandicum]